MIKTKLAVIGIILIALVATVSAYSFTAGDFVGNVHYHGGGFIGTNPHSPVDLNVTVSVSENLPPYNYTTENNQYGQGIYYLTWVNTSITIPIIPVTPGTLYINQTAWAANGVPPSKICFLLIDGWMCFNSTGWI